MRFKSPLIALLVSLLVLLAGTFSLSGCRSKKDASEPQAPVVTTEEGKAAEALPFRETATQTVAALADSAREQPSALSTDALGRLHISGLALLFVAVAARFLFGRWRDAYIATGLGIVPSILAVLLTEYSRVVLLVPLCGLALLILVVVRRVAEWRTKAAGFDATATIIEKADTGSKSLGQLMKDRIAETPVSGVIDKALTYMEKLWTK